MNASTSTAAGIPRQLFDAIERKDLNAVRDLYDPSIQVWNNIMRQPMTREQNLKLLERFTEKMKDIRYEIEEVNAWPGGCVDRHVLHGTTVDGDAIEAHVCLIFELTEGRITHLYEYLDGASVASVFGAS